MSDETAITLRPQLIGRQFGFLTVIARVSGTGRQKNIWKARCKCGRDIFTQSWTLLSGNTTSCGCKRGFVGVHGHTRNGKSLTYISWAAMVSRCTWPDHSSFKYYGNKGITVHPKWLRFECFLADMGERPGQQYNLSRLDHSQNYEPGNVKWELRSKNSRECAIRRWSKARPKI